MSGFSLHLRISLIGENEQRLEVWWDGDRYKREMADWLEGVLSTNTLAKMDALGEYHRNGSCYLIFICTWYKRAYATSNYGAFKKHRSSPIICPALRGRCKGTIYLFVFSYYSHAANWALINGQPCSKY